MKSAPESKQVEKPGDLVARLEERLLNDVELEGKLRQDYSIASLLFEREPSDETTLAMEAAFKGLEQVRRRIEQTRAGIDAARKEAKEAERLEDEELSKVRWKQAAALAKKRNKLAAEIAVDVSALSAKLQSLLGLTVELNETAPKLEMLLNSGPLSPHQVEAEFRMEMYRAGFKWASSWLGGEVGIPAFADRIVDSSAWALKFRPGYQVEVEETTEAAR